MRELQQTWRQNVKPRCSLFLCHSQVSTTTYLTILESVALCWHLKMFIQKLSCLIVRSRLWSYKKTWETRQKRTWCARQMRSRSCLCRNFATTSAPNVNETPRSFSPQPIVSLSGSDHSRSHSSPWSGTSVGRMIRRICSIDCRSGLKPIQNAHIRM